MKDELEKTQSEEQAEGLIHPSSFILHPCVEVGCLIAPTAAEIRDVMVEGQSGVEG